MKRLLALLVLACVTPSCAWQSEWVFGTTKAMYGGPSGGGGGSRSYSESSSFATHSMYAGGSSEAGVLGLVFAGLIVLPIAIDLVCLPFAVTHDLFFLD